MTALAPVRSRPTASFKMDPLNDKDSEKFIAHRIQEAKALKDWFESDAAETRW